MHDSLQGHSDHDHPDNLEAPQDVATSEFEAQLAAVANELDRLTTPALIYEAARIRLPRCPSDPDKTQFRHHLGSAIAAVKVGAYLQMMRAANRERIRIGKEIFGLEQRARDLALVDPFGAIRPKVEVPHLAGLQELEFHKFAIAINRIRVLLPIALKAAGLKLGSEDRTTLESFEPLRHFYEHVENHLPGKPNPGPAVVEEDGEDWRLSFRLPTDDTGRITLDGKTIEVDSRGAMRVQELVAREWQRMKPGLIAETEKFLLANPERLPDPGTVDSGWEVKLGGSAAGWTTFLSGDDPDWERVNGVWVRVP